jgi:hypothetical protein
MMSSAVMSSAEPAGAVQSLQVFTSALHYSSFHKELLEARRKVKMSLS